MRDQADEERKKLGGPFHIAVISNCFSDLTLAWDRPGTPASDAFSQGLMDRYEEAQGGGKLPPRPPAPLPSQECYIGRAVTARFFSLYGLYDTPALNEYLNKLGQGLSFSSRPEIYTGYRFTVLDSGEVNAFASPEAIYSLPEPVG